MKASRDIKLVKSADSFSVNIPSCGRAYVPKINFRRPGNLILGLFLVFLILLFGGLAFAADDHVHHYGNVNMVVNVATIKVSDLKELATNQLFIPARPVGNFSVRINGPTTRDGSYIVHPTYSRMKQGQNTLLSEEFGQERGVEHTTVGVDFDRSRRDPPTSGIVPMIDMKREILPIDQAREYLRGIRMTWPTNETESEVLTLWASKHKIMSDKENLQVAKYLINHFSRQRRELLDDGVILSFFDEHNSRAKRQVINCDDLKKTALWENMEKKKTTVLGFKFHGTQDLCVFIGHCKQGYAAPAGCDTAENGTDIETEFYISDSKLKSRQDMIPSADLSQYCELDGVVISRCDRTMEMRERVLFYRVLGRSGFYIGPHAVTLSPLYVGVEDFTCEGTPSPRCKGDDYFKKLFSESGSDESCSCIANSTKHMVNVKIGATNYRLDAMFYADVDVKVKKDKPEDLLCSNCEVSCSHGKVLVDYDREVELVELCSGRFCLDIRPAKSLAIPLSLAAMDDTFSYYIKFSDNKEKSGLIQCKIEDLCPLIDCHLCIEKLKNPQCYNAVDKINFLIILFTWFILLAIIVKAMRILIFGFQIIKAIIKGVFRMMKYLVKKILKLFGYDVIIERETLSRTLEEGGGVSRTITSQSSRTTVRRAMPTYIKTLTILALVAAATACSETITMDTKQLDCRMINKDLKCSTKSSAHINVAPVGQSSCFIFKTADGQAAGTLTVKTISLDLLCNKEVQYWTYPANPVFDQVCYCSGSGSGWGKDEECTKYNKNSNCGKPLKCSGSVMHSHCRTARGGWEEGCFLYSDKFCYYSVSLTNPSKRVYEVSTCSSFYWQATLEVKIQTINGDETIRMKLDPGSQSTFTGGSIRLEGASIPPIPILSKCFIKTGEFTYVSDCVKGSGIVSGMVGDIQCQSAQDAKKPSQKGCSHSPGIHNVVTQGGSLSYRYSLFNLNTLKQRLPITSGGFTIKEKAGVISASLNYMSMISLKLTLSELTLVPYSVMSQCTAKFIDAKGCVSCLTGSILRLRVKTDEGVAKAILSCPSLKADIPFRVSPREDIISLNAHFQMGIIKESCKVMCPGGPVDVRVEASLTSDVQVTRLFEDELTDFTEVATTWFNGMFGQFQYYLLVPLIGVIILGSVITLKLMMGVVTPTIHNKSW